jgi:hypothetical protein
MTRTQRRLGLAALAGAALLGLSGCLSFLHPIDPPDKELLRTCSEPACASRNRVYVFFLDGFDPLGCAGLTGLRDYAQSLGFIKTYYGQCYHAGWFGDEMRRLHHDDPDARFLLLGYGLGAAAARDLARSAAAPLDVLIYLDGKQLGDGSDPPPPCAARVVSVRGKAGPGEAPLVEGAENLRFPDAGWLDLPTHPHTLELLAEELTAAAWRVPVAVDLPRPLGPPAAEELPPPRQATPPADEPRDEWDFLKLEGPHAPPPADPRAPPRAGPGGTPARPKAEPKADGPRGPLLIPAPPKTPDRPRTPAPGV